MFLTTKYRDNVTIHPTEPCKTTAVRHQLMQKYCNRIIDNSVCITIHSILGISSFAVVEGFLVADATFTLVSFRFIEREIITCTILSQDADHIQVVLPFFANIRVPRCNLPEPIERRQVSKETIWCWNYNGEDYYYRNGAKIRVRIVEVGDGANVVATVNEQGLGLKEWWD